LEPASLTTAVSTDDRKDSQRRAALERRDAISASERASAAEAVAARSLPVPVKPGAVVAGYWPIRSEIDPRPWMKRFAEAGAQLALPVVAGRGQPLIMRCFQFGDELESGVWGIRVPRADARTVVPDILIVPLAAFDRRGNRIGYGAGYYDATIRRLRSLKPILAVGLAYAAQEAAEIPVTERDAKLDLVVTEREAIDCREPQD
jgi:5-formyltetrahydrofolate cyclo-ligase